LKYSIIGRQFIKMKTSYRILFIAAGVMAMGSGLLSCVAGKKASDNSQAVTKLTDTVRLQNGSLIYALPRTVFTVRVGLERTIMIPGPYSGYAAEMIGVKEAVTVRKEHWSIRSIEVSSHEEADPSEYYVIHSEGINTSNVIALKREGLILDLSPSVNHQDESLIPGKEMNISSYLSPDLGSDEYFQVQTDTAFRRVRVDSSFIRIPYTIEKKKVLSTDQLAEKAAKRLMELRDGKVMLLSGETTVYPQNDAVIQELNKLEKEYTELFTGKVFTLTSYYTVQIIPEKENSGKPLTLFRLSESAGPVLSGNTGTPLIAEIVSEQKTKDITIIENDPAGKQSSPAGKIFYRIPDVASFRMIFQGTTLYKSRKLVDQFGEVMQLPGNFIIGK
jgi:hypothetical protein